MNNGGRWLQLFRYCCDRRFAMFCALHGVCSAVRHCVMCAAACCAQPCGVRFMSSHPYIFCCR